MSKHAVMPSRGGRLRFTPIAIATGIAAAALLSLSLTGTLSAFTASITNDSNAAATGTLLMSETGPNASGTAVSCTSNSGASITATNTATCSTINKFGGSTSMTPNSAAVSTTVTMASTGTALPTTFTLAPTTANNCAQAAVGSPAGTATDLCTKMKLTVTATPAGGTASVIYDGTLAGLASSSAISVPLPTATGTAGATTVKFAVQLDSTANNSYQGLRATMPLTWTFSS